MELQGQTILTLVLDLEIPRKMTLNLTSISGVLWGATLYTTDEQMRTIPLEQSIRLLMNLEAFLVLQHRTLHRIQVLLVSIQRDLLAALRLLFKVL